MISPQLSSHETQVQAFLASCDASAVKAARDKYPVLSRRKWEAIHNSEVRLVRDSGDRDRCQVCGSYDARCGCCG